MLKDKTRLVLFEDSRRWRCTACEFVTGDYYLVGKHLFMADHDTMTRDSTVWFWLRARWGELSRRIRFRRKRSDEAGSAT